MESIRKLRISQVKQDRLLKHFIAGTVARTTANLADSHRNTSAYLFHRLREIILLELDADSVAMFGKKIEMDESYFGGKRKGECGRSSAGKAQYLFFLRGVKKFTPRSFPMPLVQF